MSTTNILKQAPHMQKGEVKVNKGLKVYDTIHNPDEGKRLVKINDKTSILTRCKTDEEAISKYKERYGDAT